jgi:hypothetical protein
MNPIIIAGVTITVSNDSVACKNEGVLFSTHLTNGGTNPKYQWYVKGMAIPGAVQHQFSSKALQDNDPVYCEMSSSLTCAFPENSNIISMEILPRPKPTATIGGYPDVNGYTFYSTVTNFGVTGTYQWRKNGQDIPGATDATYTATDLLPTDKIELFIHSSVPCAQPEFVMSNAMKAAQVTAVNNITAGSNISLFPNPNNGRFTVKGDVGNDKELLLEVINPVGQVIYRERIQPEGQLLEKEIDLGDKAAGIYMLNIKSENQIIPLRFIMNK